MKKMKKIENKLSDDLLVQKFTIIDKTITVKIILNDLIQLDYLDDLDIVSSKFADLGEKIDSMIHQCQIIVKSEEILEWGITNFSEIYRLQQIFLPYNKIWSLAKDFSYKIPNLM